MSAALIIENVEIEGRPGSSVRIEDGRIAAIGRRVDGTGERMDGGGGALIAGLIDHHIHLLATAAASDSVDLSGVRDRADFRRRLGDACSKCSEGEWIRAVGFHEHGGALPTLDELDAIASRHPLRIQHQTGGLWLLNSRALEKVAGTGALPRGAERGEGGRATGRFWREDGWLRERIGNSAPSLGHLGRDLSRLGITGVTDASITNDPQSARLLADAHESGLIPQRLMLMSGGRLSTDPRYLVGPVKILLDDDRLPDLDAMAALIREARTLDRNVAIHCATAVQLAFAVAALAQAGTKRGDRIEHGSVIPVDMLGVIAAMGLVVVTQPIFCRDRGDRYLDRVGAEDRDDLYRCASLEEAGICVAAGSDAPYGSLDPWASMRAAVSRTTLLGRGLGLAERVSPARALALYQGDFTLTAEARRISVGQQADLCLLEAGMDEVLTALDGNMVRATFVAGRCIYER